MKNSYNLAEYNLIFNYRQNNNLYKVVITIFIIVIILLICKFKFYIYQNSILLKTGSNYEIIADINNIKTISTNKKIIINRQEYIYNVISANEDFSNINGTIYEKLLINIPNYSDNNKILKCSFLIKKETLLDMLLKFIKGG